MFSKRIQRNLQSAKLVRSGTGTTKIQGGLISQQYKNTHNKYPHNRGQFHTNNNDHHNNHNQEYANNYNHNHDEYADYGEKNYEIEGMAHQFISKQ